MEQIYIPRYLYKKWHTPTRLLHLLQVICWSNIFTPDTKNICSNTSGKIQFCKLHFGHQMYIWTYHWILYKETTTVYCKNHTEQHRCNVYAKCTNFTVKPGDTLGFSECTIHLDWFIMSQTVQLDLPLEGRMNTETTRAWNGTQQLQYKCWQYCRVAVLSFVVLMRQGEWYKWITSRSIRIREINNLFVLWKTTVSSILIRCNSMHVFIYCKITLYMFWVSIASIIRRT
jgi:hypothetical protein